MKEVKFKAWHKAERKMCDVQIINFDKGAFLLGISPGKDEIGDKYYVKAPEDGRFCTFDEFELLEYTGLKDKNGGQSTCIYEGDFVSLSGIVIGNKYENEELGQDSSNLPIEGFGTRTWRITEEKAMGRGCSYS